MAFHQRLYICVFIVLSQLFTLTMVNAAENRLRFGVFPHLPTRDLETVYAPIAAELSTILGKHVVFESSSSFENFSERLDQGIFDIVFVQPFDYIRIAGTLGYEPVAARGEKLSALFTVLPESSIHNIDDLRGKTVALPPEVSAVSRLVRSHLRDNGIDPDRDLRIVYRRSHSSCLQQILIKAADVCGTAAPPKRFFENKMKVSLKVIAETGFIPSSLFAIHPRISERDKKFIRHTILTFGLNKKGKKILERGKLTPFQVIKDDDYDVVRHIMKNAKSEP